MDAPVQPRTTPPRGETAADDRPEAAQQSEEARLEALFQLSQMVDASFHEVVAFGMETGIRLTGSQIGYLALVNDDETRMIIHSWSQAVQAACRMEQQPIEFPLQSGGFLAEAVRQRRPFVVNDYAAPDPRKKGLPPGHVSITRYLCIPILHNRKAVLVAAVANKAEDYNPSDVRQLTLLMQGVWLHLERRKTEEALRQHRDELERLVALRTAELNERVKEMQCLRAISEVLEEMPGDDLSALQRVVELLPRALRRPEAAGAQLTLNGKRWSTAGYRETLQRLSAPVFVEGSLAGAVDVCYLDDNPAATEKPFLDEELALVEEVGRMLGNVLQRNLSEAKAKSLKRQIEQVLEVTRTGLRIFDADLNVLYVDPARQSLQGPARRNDCKDHCGGSNGCHDGDLSKALTGKRQVVSDRIIHADGGRPVQVTTIPYQDADGRWLVAQVEVDLSERKRIEQELSQV
ncbi:MAG: GAF domain-containing protein, partial [Thermoguttaceae bacterium]|nr:GAF domain-containing protein [Thermoguttaceae bacterium]